MRTATLLSPRFCSRTATTTPRVTGGTLVDGIDPVPFASGEKLLEMASDRSIAEVRRRYDTFETVVGMIASLRSSQPSGASPPLGPDKVKFHSLRELVGGRIPKDDVIRRLYASEPRLAMLLTRDEILDEPFRRICGLPDFLENYRDEKLGLGGNDTPGAEEYEEDDHLRFVEARTGGGGGGGGHGYSTDQVPDTTTKGKQTKRYKAVYGQKAVRVSAAMRDQATLQTKSPPTFPSDKMRS